VGKLINARLARAIKEILWPCGARIFEFWRGFGEGACPQRPVTEPKRSQNSKRPLSQFHSTAWLQYFFNRSKLTLWLSLLSALTGKAGQFVDLTAEIETIEWSYHFLDDKPDPLGKPKWSSGSIFEKAQKIHCIIGTNSWFMECGDDGWYQGGKAQIWFTGTNVVTAYEITRNFTNDQGDVYLPGFKSVEISDAFDGNPGRPVNVRNFVLSEQFVPWIALCSGPVLKMKDRHIYPPWDLWKETGPAPKVFTDKTTVFADCLGLPISMTLFASTTQPVFQYQAHQSTNVLGWNFPLEFYMVQYEPDFGHYGITNWLIAYTARGRIKSIGPGKKFEVPAEILKAGRSAGR
jgi:hypothetical protein